MKECRAVSDMYFIAALLSYGYTLVRTDKTNPRRQKFFFDLENEVDVFVVIDDVLQTVSANIDELEAYFLSRQLLLTGRYVDSLKEVRATIHGHQEDNSRGY